MPFPFTLPSNVSGEPYRPKLWPNAVYLELNCHVLGTFYIGKLSRVPTAHEKQRPGNADHNWASAAMPVQCAGVSR